MRAFVAVLLELLPAAVLILWLILQRRVHRRAREKREAELSEQIRELWLNPFAPDGKTVRIHPGGEGGITSAKIAANCITAGKIADNVELPPWFKIYKPEELEAALAERRRVWELSDPWIIRTPRQAFRAVRSWWQR